MRGDKMILQHVRQPAPLESALMDVVKTLHPRRAAQVLDFARWLQTQPAPDDELSDNVTDLLRSPKNAKRLLESILELEKGGGTARGLIE